MKSVIQMVRDGEDVDRQSIQCALKAARELYPQLLGSLYKGIVRQEINDLQTALEHTPHVPPKGRER